MIAFLYSSSIVHPQNKNIRSCFSQYIIFSYAFPCTFSPIMKCIFCLFFQNSPFFTYPHHIPLPLCYTQSKGGIIMKEYKAIYNETLDTVTFYDENGESHLLYVHTKEDHEYLCDKWLNTAYVRILNFIIAFMFPVFLISFIGNFDMILGLIIKSPLSIFLIIGGCLVCVFLSFLFFACGIHMIVKSGTVINSWKLALYAKEDKHFHLIVCAFLILMIPAILLWFSTMHGSPHVPA